MRHLGLERAECKYSKVLGDSNKWLIVELEQRELNDTSYFPYQREEANLLKLKIRNHITLKVANDIEEGYIGAVVTSDEDADGGYYLIKWTGTPYTDQESGELVCPGDYLMPVGRAPKWVHPRGRFSCSLGEACSPGKGTHGGIL